MVVVDQPYRPVPAERTAVSAQARVLFVTSTARRATRPMATAGDTWAIGGTEDEEKG